MSYEVYRRCLKIDPEPVAMQAFAYSQLRLVAIDKSDMQLTAREW